MEKVRLYRQGDVLIKSLSKKPTGKKKIRIEGILAEGETTGHMHRVEDTTKAEVYEIGKKLLLSTAHGIRILHEEHDPITLPKGHYQVIRQRESTGVGRKVHRVLD